MKARTFLEIRDRNTEAPAKGGDSTLRKVDPWEYVISHPLIREDGDLCSYLNSLRGDLYVL